MPLLSRPAAVPVEVEVTGFAELEPDGVEAAYDAARRAVVRRYRGLARGHRYYVRSKLVIDPVGRELTELVAHGRHFGALLDAGAGRGQFPLLLHALGAVTSIAGFDLDPEKVEAAGAASAGLGVLAEFTVADLEDFRFPPVDTVLFFDSLHYLDREAQARTLARAVEALRPGGCLLVRETSQGGLGPRLARFLERVHRILGIHRGRGLDFVRAKDLRRKLVELGLEVEKRSGRGVLSNVLLVANKPA